MIACLAYTADKQDQAANLGLWLGKLGSHGSHTLVIFVESRVSRHIAADLLPLFQDVIEVSYVDHLEHYPESQNLAFQQAANYCELNFRSEKWFLYFAANSVPMRAGWLDAIEQEARAANKPFSGSRIAASPRYNTPEHMAAVGVYPVQMVKVGAGPALNAHDQPFQAAIGGVTTRMMHSSTLIVHAIEDNQPVPTECALFTPDRDGSILAGLLSGTGKVTSASGDLAQPGPESGSDAPPQPTIGPEQMPQLVEKVKELAAQSEFEPWKDRQQTEDRIMKLAEELKTFCTAPMHTSHVRKILKRLKVSK